jgi:hypothetical protein
MLQHFLHSLLVQKGLLQVRNACLLGHLIVSKAVLALRIVAGFHVMVV